MKKHILIFLMLPAILQAQQIPSEVNNFSNQLLGKLRTNGKNTFCSPIGVSYVSAMLYAGSGGKTRSDLEQIMKFINPSVFDEFENFSAQINAINTKKEVEIRIANGIWNRMNIKKDFSRIILEKFHSESFPLTTEIPINDWASEKTNGKIKNLLPPGSITGDIMMVLANAIYFKGDWKYRFDSTKTKKEWFYKESGSKTKTELMFIETVIGYLPSNDFDMIELPYKGDELAMRVFLPHKDKTISDLIQTRVIANTGIYSMQKVKVFLPKMELDAEYDLKGPMTDLGLGSLFNGADFSGMADAQLQVDKMLQKAYLKMDEKGTEAAAVTVATVMTTSAVAPVHVEVPVFRADRPFLFTIIHKTTGTILFAGTMEDPELMKEN
ncbi:MAG: serpin family protein [Bacteroidia bacterium]